MKSLAHLIPSSVFIVTFFLPMKTDAAILVSWNFNTNVAPTIVASGSVASAGNATLSVGVSGGFQNNASASNVGPNPGNGTWSGSSLGSIRPYALGTSDAINGGTGFHNSSNYGTSPDSTKFVEFSLTLGASIDSSVSLLEGITFNLSNAGTSGPRGFEVTYRIGAGSFTSLGGTAVPTLAANQYGLFTFNLGTPVALAASDVVTFRLLGYANAPGNSVRLDNVSINAVPEPTAAALLTGAGLLLLLRRRRPIS